MKRLRAVFCLSLALCSGWCWPQTQPATSQPAKPLPELRLAALFAQSGEAVSNDSASVAVVRYLVAQHNQRPSRRFQVNLLEFDTQSSALGARRAATQAVQAKVHLVLGANWSALSMAMAPVLQQARIPMLSPASTQNELTSAGAFIFRLNYNNNVLGEAAAVFARRQLRARTAVVMTNQSQVYSQQLTRIFIQQFKALGGTILQTADYLRDTTDFAQSVRQLQATGADMLFVPGYGPDTGRIIRQLRATPSLMPVLCADGCIGEMYRYAGKDLRHTYGLFYWHPSLPGMAQHPFQQWLTAHNMQYFNPVPLVYDAVQLILHCAGQLGTFSAETLQTQLAATHDFRGITGTISFDLQRNPDKVVQAIDLSQPQGRYIGPILLPSATATLSGQRPEPTQ